MKLKLINSLPWRRNTNNNSYLLHIAYFHAKLKLSACLILITFSVWLFLTISIFSAIGNVLRSCIAFITRASCHSTLISFSYTLIASAVFRLPLDTSSLCSASRSLKLRAVAPMYVSVRLSSKFCIGIL